MMEDTHSEPRANELLKMFIMDVLMYDIEQISSILRLLNANGGVGWRRFWPRDYTIQDVTSVLPELVQDGYLDVYDYSEKEKCLVPLGAVGFLPENFGGNEERYWYLLTKKGKEMCDEWEPPSV